MNLSILKFGLIALVLTAFSLPGNGHSQTTPLLQLTSLERNPGNPARITFTDFGTGATNYLVEFSPSLSIPVEWTPVPEATITPLGGGAYQAVVPDPATTEGFFRVRTLGTSSNLVTASFNSTALEVSEGGMISPEIHFTGPYFGNIGYTITGTALNGDTTSISGQVTVNGTSATIPLSIEDNDPSLISFNARGWRFEVRMRTSNPES